MRGLGQSSIGEGILRVRDPVARCLRIGRSLRPDRDHRGFRSREEKRGRIIGSLCRASHPSSRSNDSLGTFSLTFSDAITFGEHLVLVSRFEVFVTFSPLVFVSLGASWSFRCHLLGKPAVSAIVARGSSVGQGDGREGVGVVARRCMARGDSSALWQLG